MLVRLLHDLNRSISVLDLGCGSGRHLALLDDLGFHSIFGADSSSTSIELCQKHFKKVPLYHTGKSVSTEFSPQPLNLPIKTNTLGLVIAWGVLHYNSTATQKLILTEIARLLTPDGYFIGTVRSTHDTYLAMNADLSHTNIQLFTEEEVETLLQPYFKAIKIGHMQRSDVHNPKLCISHWYFKCSVS